MTEAPALPAPSIPEPWDEIDTSIDTEPPEYLSEDQFERHVEAVLALLTAAGLQARRREHGGAGALQVRNRHGDHILELDLHEDRGADWTLTADGALPEGTSSQNIAAHVTQLLQAAAPTPAANTGQPRWAAGDTNPRM